MSNTERDNTAWMRDDLTKACQHLGLTNGQAEFIADQFAAWAVEYLRRRVTHELQHQEVRAA